MLVPSAYWKCGFVRPYWPSQVRCTTTVWPPVSVSSKLRPRRRTGRGTSSSHVPFSFERSTTSVSTFGTATRVTSIGRSRRTETGDPAEYRGRPGASRKSETWNERPRTGSGTAMRYHEAPENSARLYVAPEKAGHTATRRTHGSLTRRAKGCALASATRTAIVRLTESTVASNTSADVRGPDASSTTRSSKLPGGAAEGTPGRLAP